MAIELHHECIGFRSQKTFIKMLLFWGKSKDIACAISLKGEILSYFYITPSNLFSSWFHRS